MSHTEGLAPANIGQFELSAQFVTASPAVVAAIDPLFDGYQSHFSSIQAAEGYHPFDTALAYFGAADGDIAAIYQSFLGKVASDVLEIVHAAEDISNLVVRLPRPIVFRSCSAGAGFHEDERRVPRQALGIRYNAANHTPTIVKGLSRLQPGEVVRMPPIM